MIYFLQPLTGGPVKIGCTVDLPSRIKRLESTYGKSLVVLFTMNGGRTEESTVHRRFKSLRLDRGKGKRKVEQFRPGLALMEFIGRPDLAVSDDVVVEPMADDPAGPLGIVVSLRMTPERKAWMKRAASCLRVPLASCIDLSVAQFVKTQGFKEEPPKR